MRFEMSRCHLKPYDQSESNNEIQTCFALRFVNQFVVSALEKEEFGDGDDDNFFHFFFTRAATTALSTLHRSMDRQVHFYRMHEIFFY